MPQIEQGCKSKLPHFHASTAFPHFLVSAFFSSAYHKISHRFQKFHLFLLFPCDFWPFNIFAPSYILVRAFFHISTLSRVFCTPETEKCACAVLPSKWSEGKKFLDVIVMLCPSNTDKSIQMHKTPDSERSLFKTWFLHNWQQCWKWKIFMN